MISVAIDGPAGAGKSSVSRMAALKLGYIYVDTGALYRAIGLKFLNSGYDESLECDVNSVLKNTCIDIKFTDGVQRVILDGEDVSDKIRTPKASMMASAVSAKPTVRDFLLEMQRRLARENNVLMDGRDIGTVVLPNADVKIYLTASVEERAARRYRELKEKDPNITLEAVKSDIEQRDHNDMNRAVAPLKKADDAVLADTTGLDVEQSVDLIIKIVTQRVGKHN